MASVPVSVDDLGGIQGHGTNGSNENQIQDYDVIIVGAGFSGIANLHRLRQDGLKAHIYEGGAQSSTTTINLYDRFGGG
jgi:NADH dehydrogenase FAD-containing subunit